MKANLDLSAKVLALFQNVPLNFSETREDFSDVKIVLIGKVSKKPLEANYDKITNWVNNRDTLSLSILREDEVIENLTIGNRERFSSFMESINSYLMENDEIKIIITIVKKNVSNTISIYFLKEFIHYLESLSFMRFLNVIENNLRSEKLILENQYGDTIDEIFKSRSILLINKGSNSKIEIIENEMRSERINSGITLCHWDTEKKSIIPDDFYPSLDSNKDSALFEIFQKVCLLYTTMFIFDYSGIKESIFSYKLNGYKTFGQEIKVDKVKNINIDLNSTDLFYKIYQWSYAGGNINDKISIARNIISLNFNPKTLQLSQTAFDSILSNYKIYERQNVKQYIEIRNKLSEILIELQVRIDKIVQNFINDFKKSIITLLSFFISVIVIRVVSKGDFIGGFTPEIIILSFSFLLISLGILFYSRWEFTKRIFMFDKHYDQLKDRYKELLTKDELDKIFEDCNPRNNGSKSFIDQQKKFYTFLWIGSLGILSIALIIIISLNNPSLGSCLLKYIRHLL